MPVYIYRAQTYAEITNFTCFAYRSIRFFFIVDSLWIEHVEVIRFKKGGPKAQ